MVKKLAGLLPLAVALAIFAALVSFLLGRNMAIGPWLLAAFLVGHGLVHLMFITPQPSKKTPDAPDFPFDLAKSWLTTRLGMDARTVRSIAVVVLAAIVVGFALAGLSTIGVIVPSGWWPGLVMGSAALSGLLLVVAFNPELVLGFAIDAGLAWLVLSVAWLPGGAVGA